MYVERSFRDAEPPSFDFVNNYTREVVRELQMWGFISTVEVASPSWIPTAYTWKRIDSRWAAKAIQALADRDIITTGRYGKWRFQGIAQSILDGFVAGALTVNERYSGAI
jgi:hypothetical protein